MKKILFYSMIAAAAFGFTPIHTAKAASSEGVKQAQPLEMKRGGNGKHKGWAKGNRGKHKGWGRGRGNQGR